MSRYAVSDLHGMLGLYQAIDKFLKPDDVVYCLGDCGDRGPNSWETIKAVAKNPKFIYLKGNHEDMLVKAGLTYLNDQDINDDIYLLLSNDGCSTFEGWLMEENQRGWITYLKDLPTHIEFVNSQGIEVLLSHAGYTPNMQLPSDYELLWDRKHFYDIWPNGKEKSIVVHGHTPIQLLWKDFNELTKIKSGTEIPSWDGGAFYYGDRNHKVCIDCGCYASKQTILFDLDTFDEHIFVLSEDEDYLKNN